MNINPTPHDHVVFTDFDGVEGILVDLNTKKYYQLNETAMMIWKGLEQGRAPGAIAEDIVAQYEVTAEEARANVEKTVAQFAAYKLLTE